LRQSDFETYPVWVNCHVEDYDEPWYDDTDEETFRPWTKELPVSPNETMYLVSASFELNDKTTLKGFLTPDFENKGDNALGHIQPNLLTDNGPVGFWTGMFPIDEERRKEIYKQTNKTPDQLFPINLRGLPALPAAALRG
jgi:hypothetical protein